MTKFLLVFFGGFMLVAFAEPIVATFGDGFEGWGNWKSDNSVVQFRHDPDIGHKSPGSLCVILGPEHPMGKSVCFTKHLPVEPAKTYTGLVFVKTEGIDDAASISLGFQGQDEKKKFLGTESLSTRIKGSQVKAGEWKRLVYTVRVPSEGKWESVAQLLCTIGVNNSEKGKVWFDDFQFFVNQ